MIKNQLNDGGCRRRRETSWQTQAIMNYLSGHGTRLFQWCVTAMLCVTGATSGIAAATKAAPKKVNEGRDSNPVFAITPTAKQTGILPIAEVGSGMSKVVKLGSEGFVNPSGPIESQPVPSGGTCPAPSSCGPCQSTETPQFHAMASWAVSQPFINLWVTDVPLRYQPPRGPEIAFLAAWRQRETNPVNTAWFNLGTNWNCAWRSWVREENATTATLFPAGGGALVFTNTGGWVDYDSGARLERLTNAGSLSGYRLTHVNGAIDTYDYAAPGSPNVFFISQQENLHGHAVTFQYQTSGSQVRLLGVVDASGQTNTLSYSSNAFSANLISAVIDPFGRTATFSYDGNGRLTNLVDPIGISSRFRYSASGDITNLITPYGTTKFELSGGDIALDGSGVATPRAVKVTHPNGAQELYAFFNVLTNASTTAGAAFPTGCSSSFHDEICDGAQETCVSFHWTPRQFDLLSAGAKANVSSVTAADCRLGTLTRWLRAGDTNVLGATPAMVGLPIPSADQTVPGQTYWFGYAGSEGLVEPAARAATLFAHVVSPSEEFYDRPAVNAQRKLLQSTDTYTQLDGSAGTRIRKYAYAGNGWDLLIVTNALGNTVARYGYNTRRQAVAFTNAVGDVTRYTYNADGDLVMTEHPTGLITSNYLNSAGYLLQSIDQQINRTNVYTYASGLPQTHTDPRGLTLTYGYDALQRIVSVSYPDGTYTSNRYQNLDLVGSRDRHGNWTTYGYNEMRWRTSQTNALGEVEFWNYCTCGALDSHVDVLNHTTSYYYDLQMRLIGTVYPDGSWKTNYFNPLGQLTNSVDSCGRSTTNSFNLQGQWFAATNSLLTDFFRRQDAEDRAIYLTGANSVTTTNTYDAAGRLVASADPSGYRRYQTYVNGQLVASGTACATNYYGYDVAGRRVAETNAVGDITRWTYSPAGDVTSVRSPLGLTTTNTYDVEGHLTQSVDLEIARTNAATYAAGEMVSQTDARGLTTALVYDALDRLVSTQFPDGTYRSNRFNGPNLVASRNRLGVWTYTGYDSMNRRVAETNEVGSVTRFGYTCNWLTSLTNAMNEVTSYTYDVLGRLTAITQPDNTWIINSYNNLGQLVTNRTSAGQINVNFYDSAGRVYRIDNAVGTVTLRYFDACGRITNTVDGNGVSVISLLDPLGRAVARSFPDGGVERLSYGPAGILCQTNQINFLTRYAYDVAGRKIAETNANLEVVQYGYSAAGDLTSLTDGKNQVTTWKFDPYGLVTNRTDTTGATMFRYLYDAQGRVTNRWTPAKGTTAYTYDGAGNLTKVDYPTSPDITFTVDSLGRVTNMVDAVGTSRFAYHSTGQVLTEDGPFDADTVTYSYTNGQLASVSVAAAPGFSPWTTTYGWDVGNRFQSVSSPAGIFTYGYGGAGTLPIHLAVPGGARITNAYDSVARMSFTRYYGPTNNLLNEHSYSYNVGGQVTRQTRTFGDYVDYGYDPSGQLTSAKGEELGSSSRDHEQFGYTYDAAGNLSFRTNNNLIQRFQVNSLNELTTVGRSGTLTAVGVTEPAAVSVTVNGFAATRFADNSFAKAGLILVDGTNTFTAVAQATTGRSDTTTTSVWLPATNVFTYDVNGNLTSDDRQFYEWDDENQLIRVGATNSWKTEFEYDGLGRRRIRREFIWAASGWHLEETVQYIWQEKCVIQERRASVVGNTSNTTSAIVGYLRGRDLSGSLSRAGGVGGILGRLEQRIGSDLVVRHVHADHLGNISMATDASGSYKERIVYEAFGEVMASSRHDNSISSYGWSSQELHRRSGLVLYTYRAYSPSLQRWLSRDLIDDDRAGNTYRYCGNWPNGAFDPDGLRAQIGLAMAVKPDTIEDWAKNMIPALVKKVMVERQDLTTTFDVVCPEGSTKTLLAETNITRSRSVTLTLRQGLNEKIYESGKYETGLTRYERYGCCKSMGCFSKNTTDWEARSAPETEEDITAQFDWKGFKSRVFDFDVSYLAKDHWKEIGRVRTCKEAVEPELKVIVIEACTGSLFTKKCVRLLGPSW